MKTDNSINDLINYLSLLGLVVEYINNDLSFLTVQGYKNVINPAIY